VLSDGSERLLVEVFYFRVWNIPDSCFESPPFKATRDFIKKSNGRIIAGTKEEVQLSQLDEAGRYISAKKQTREASRS
jgi:hypothetical protein